MKQTLFRILIFSLLFSSCKKKEDVKVADELKYQADFSSDDYTWLTDANHYFLTGSYRMTQSQQSYQSWGIAPFNTINYNYSIATDATLYVSSGYFGGIGIVYNFIDSENYYAFYIRNDGSVYAFKQYGKVFTTLLAPTYSKAVKTVSGQKNYIEVRQSGSTATFVVNSAVVGSCSAPRGNGLVSAGVALSTASSPYFTPLTGDFDNVTIKKIQ